MKHELKSLQIEWIPTTKEHWNSLLLNNLSTPEKQRFEKSLSPEKAWRFALCRSLLRKKLQEHLRIEPKVIEIKMSPLGKPFLPKIDSVYFSLSHTEDLSVLAISPKPIGIDVEWVIQDGSKNYEKILKRVLADEDSLKNWRNSQDKLATFYSLWTAHEAIVKLKGESAFSTQLDVNTVRKLCHFQTPIKTQEIRLDLLKSPLADRLCYCATYL